MTHYQNPYLPHSLRNTEGTVPPAPAPKKALPMVDAETGVPIGTAVQVLDWVGDDVDRARAALAREKGQPKPRVTLVTELTALIRRSVEPVPVVEPAFSAIAADVEVPVTIRQAVANPEAILTIESESSAT